MTRILVVGEDTLCCALGERLIAAAMPGWQLAGPSIDKKGITKLVPDLGRYAQQAANVQPVLCIADTDGDCVVDLLAAWRPAFASENLLLRLAVTEAESWLLADREGFSSTLQVPKNKLPARPDDMPDPKRFVLNLVARSRKRVLRDEVISQDDPNKPGPGYNLHLGAFVRRAWSAASAREASPSLDRALTHLERLARSRR